ncbi:hypothetical protein [Leisingera sp. JC1]|uniref:hypothetical protein n=1 Tax=Leisingera sp. JC1 TaxID=1855282 RepID=UPI0011314A1F|nr:hypothetical protein [Leisingera sp. JC1]
MNSQKTGIALLIGAVILAVVVFSLKPPSGLGEAMMRVSQNPNAMFLKPPVFYGGLVVAAIMAIFGLVKLTERDADQ